MSNTNCPNCGAPITGPECEYCGTKFDIKVIDWDILVSKNECLQSITLQEELYTKAISAMKCYGYGFITANEARRRIGYAEV